MKSKTIKTLIRPLACILAVFSALSCFGIGLSASESESTGNALLRNGIYRIRNVSNGMYLSAYTGTSSFVGKAYLKNFDPSDNGQCFLITSENGEYRFSPMNENANYSLSWAGGTAAGSLIGSVPTAEDSLFMKFELSLLSDGNYTISHTRGDNAYGVLGVSELRTDSKDPYASFVNFLQSDMSQQWQFELVPTTRITAAYNITKVRLYTTGKFYARKYPFNMVTDDIVWTSSDDEVLMIGENGVWCALSEGEVRVTASVDNVSVSFTVKVSPDYAFTWFSQNNIFTSDWDGTILQKVFFSAGGIKRVFALDAKASPYYSNWIDSGCGLCSVAQVLHNLGATYANGYDLRSGQNGDIPADPYSVALANTGNRGALNENETINGNPTYMSWRSVLSKFYVNGEEVTSRKINYPSRETIKKLLDTHPQGLVAQLVSGSKNHYVVIGKCINPDAVFSAQFRFTLYDPAAYFPEKGDGVPFEESTSYTYEKYRYTSILSVMVVDVASNVNN